MRLFQWTSLSCVALLVLGCKGWTDDGDDTGDPIVVDTDTGDTEDTDTDTGDVEVNLPPSAPEVAIEPAEPVEEDDLNCVITAQSVDPEGAQLSYHYSWDVDGQDPEIDSSTVEASNTWVNQTWTCKAWSDDGKHESDAATASVEIQQACNDFGPGEPNESESDAVSLGEMGDGDDAKELEGLLDGHGDRDWYLFVGRDTATAWMGPGLEISGGTVPVRACFFASCLNGLGKTELECKDGSTAMTSAAGLPGCCSYARFEVDLNCTSTISDDAAIYILVYTDMENVCEPYTISYWY
jgi:hypothetical protein